MNDHDGSIGMQMHAEFFEGHEIRITPDKTACSAYDILRALGYATPQRQWDHIKKSHPDIVHGVNNIKFPGRKQKPTPGLKKDDLLKLLMMLPGEKPAQVREWAAKVLTERLEEEADPELGIRRSRERAFEKWRRDGKAGSWIQIRLSGTDQRHKFTDSLKAHGCEGWHYGVCTNAIYIPVLGADARGAARERGIVKGNLRDHLSDVELAAIALAEALAEKGMDVKKSNGVDECRGVCEDSGKRVRLALQ